MDEEEEEGGDGRDTLVSERARRTRRVAALSLLLALVGLLYWIPVVATAQEALAGGTEALPGGGAWNVRMASAAIGQFGPGMARIGLGLGALLALLSALQVPGAVGTFLLRRWGTALLRGIAITKLVLYGLAGIIVATAVIRFAQLRQDDWRLSAATFAADVLVLLFYAWVAHALTEPVAAGAASAEASS